MFTDKPICGACGEGRMLRTSRLVSTTVRDRLTNVLVHCRRCSNCGAELVDEEDSLDNRREAAEALRLALLEETPNPQFIRPWKVLRVQIANALHCLVHWSDRTLTYTDGSYFKVLGLAWKVEFLAISRLTMKNVEHVLYQKPGPYAEMRIQQLRNLRKVTQEYHERMAKGYKA